MVDGYALACAALVLTAGFLGDRSGARRVCLAGMGLLAAASLGCGRAPTGHRCSSRRACCNGSVPR
jgi:DHA2 family methylenomycin A resistance protein-like MFS transporter